MEQGGDAVLVLGEQFQEGEGRGYLAPSPYAKGRQRQSRTLLAPSAAPQTAARDPRCKKVPEAVSSGISPLSSAATVTASGRAESRREPKR